MQLEPEGRVAKILDKMLSYIAGAIILSISICGASSMISGLVNGIFSSPSPNVSFTRDENPAMPCGIEDRYVVVTNNSSSAVNLEGWRVTNSGKTYTFPNRWLQPSESIKLWSGSGTDDTHNLYAGQSRDAWRFSYGLTVESKKLFGGVSLHSWQIMKCDPVW